MRKTGFFLFVITCFQICSFQSAAQTILNIKTDLIKITQELQACEVSLSQNEKDFKLLKKREQQIFKSIANQQHLLAAAFRSIQHLKDYSPILVALSSVSLEDLVHSLLIVQSCAPRLEKQNRSILESLKAIVEIREQIQRQSSDYRRLKEIYNKNLRSQSSLFESKFHQHSFSITPELEKLRQKSDLLKSMSLEKVLKELDVFLAKEQAEENSDLKLINIAVGRKLPERDNNKEIKISARPEAQIVSPFDAIVVYTGAIPGKSQFIVLKRGPYFAIIEGLGSINCRVGENVLEGEPIGCALSWTSISHSDQLQKKLKNEEKIISLQLRKGTQIIDSSLYLRPTPDDKKI
jgi:septal ring factor EnvC (AmiA/AmiB activator)